MTYTATYSPEDNKIRISASSRLDPETYAKVKAAGFAWAPKQQIFVAPKWTPQREDLAIELAGEIDDEDISLVDRAEQRAERFEDYSEKRLDDAHRAKAAVDRIADGIPLGQPILVGHHSERHARRDAEKIENGMRRAVRMWETSKYWESRAAGAIRAAKYKEIPAVRARRIKTIEAEIRSMVADYTPRPGVPATMQEPWNWKPTPGLSFEESETERAAAKIPHVWVGPAGRGGRWTAERNLERTKAGYARAIAHCEMRLVYERAMLAESGGLAADKFDLAVGGRVQYGGTWYAIARLNKKGGAVCSVSLISSSWPSVLNIEDIKGYEPPAEGDTEKVSKVTKLAPLVNFRAPGCIEMTAEEWKAKSKYSDSSFVAAFSLGGEYAGWGKRGDYRQRSLMRRTGAREEYFSRIPVFLTDSKVIEAPQATTPAPSLEGITPVKDVAEALARPVYQPRERTEFDSLKDSLKAGVQVVSAPQLFATPVALAATMAQLAGIDDGDEVLEPSAGTGRLAEAIRAHGGKPFMVEVNHALCENLARRFDPKRVLQGDFLEQNGNLGKFDAVLMNPPFANADDIKHIRHAVKFLKPGGTLVAICANGPRQREALMDLATHWKDLPAGTFAEAGTGVNTALLVVRA